MQSGPDVPTRMAQKFYQWVESELIALAQFRLQTAPYAELSGVTCDIKGGVLRLRGTVPRYYLKQHAYRIVADLKGVRHVENDIVVRTYAETHSEPIAGIPAA